MRLAGRLCVVSSVTGSRILDVDLLAFERGDRDRRAAVVDGVMRSLQTGFVTTSHDVPEEHIDEAYALLARFFSLPTEAKARWGAPGSHGQTGYTGLLIETAAGAESPDWKEMLNWGRSLSEAHPLRRRYPHRYLDPVLPDDDVPGIAAVLVDFHDRMLDLQRRFLRIIAVGIGAAEDFFDGLLRDGPTLTRAIRYPAMADAPSDGHVWAGEHGDINLTTVLPRATARGLQVRTADGWVDATAPEGHVVVNTGIMLERLTNGLIPVGLHRVVADPGSPGERYSVVQFAHPTPWTQLGPLPSCVGPDRPVRYPSMEAGDLLDQVLYDINLLGS